MIITNIEQVPGKIVAAELGLVQGSTVRSKHLGKDIGAFFKSLIGGEIKSYSELLEEGRNEAIERMKEQADALGRQGPGRRQDEREPRPGRVAGDLDARGFRRPGEPGLEV